MSYSLSKIREKGGGRERGGEEGKGRAIWRCVPHSWTPQNIYAWQAVVTVSLTFGNSNYGNTPVAAASMKWRAWPSVCVVLPDNLFLTDIKWPRSKCYAKPQCREARLWLVIIIITKCHYDTFSMSTPALRPHPRLSVRNGFTAGYWRSWNLRLRQRSPAGQTAGWHS